MPSTFWFSLILKFQVPCFLITSSYTSNSLPLDILTPKILYSHHNDLSIGATVSQPIHVLPSLPSEKFTVYYYNHTFVNTLKPPAFPSFCSTNQATSKSQLDQTLLSLILGLQSSQLAMSKLKEKKKRKEKQPYTM